ncbi:MAG: hypothetical protein HW380_3811 [Magnetococcales bacterium]|nr:hypothetical protein [Magnetococcales bacterium]
MALHDSETAQITTHVSEHVKFRSTEWMAGGNMGRSLPMYEIEIRERVLRVVRELRHQRELMQQGFEQVDKHFEKLGRHLDARFENLIRRLDRFLVFRFDDNAGRYGNIHIKIITINSRGR